MFSCVYLKNTTVMGPVYPRGFSFTLNESIYPLFSFFKLLIFISQNSSYLSPAALGIHSIFAMISITIEVFLFSKPGFSLSLSPAQKTLPQNTSIRLSFFLMVPRNPPPHSSPSTVSHPLWSLLSAEPFHLSFAFICTPLVCLKEGWRVPLFHLS